MKKSSLRKSCMLLFLMFLTGCSDDSSDNSLVGYWRQYSYTNSYRSVETGEILKESVITDIPMANIKFEDDGSYTRWFGGESFTGTYNVKDRTLYLFEQSRVIEYKIDFPGKDKMFLYKELDKEGIYLDSINYPRDNPKAIKAIMVYGGNYERLL